MAERLDPPDAAPEGEARALTLCDGTVLRGRAWRVQGEARGTVVLVHGLGEHIGRYTRIARFLNGQGLDAVGFDQRGHGTSDGVRGALPHRHALLWDVSGIVQVVRAEHPQRPLLLFGHSMGGLVAARFVADQLQSPPSSWWLPVEALVLSSPALAVDVPAWRRLAARAASVLLPNVSLANGLEPGWVSRSPEVVAAYDRDPLDHTRITPRLASFILEEGDTVRALASAWRTPTTVLWAGSDRCVDPAGSAAFVAAAPATLVRGRAFPPLYHEIFNEPERETVFAVLAEALATLPSPATEAPP